MPTLWITRHGESEHNLHTHLFMGRWPSAQLTETGKAQATALGKRLAQEQDRPLAIVHSSLPRTTQTAQRIAEAMGTPVTLFSEDAFWELSKGSWEGVMRRDSIPPEFKRLRDGDPFLFQYPGGESYQQVWLRVGPALDHWMARLQDQHVLFVLHGDVIRAVFYHLLRFPPQRIEDFITDPCALNEFKMNKGRAQVMRLNDTAHLTQNIHYAS